MRNITIEDLIETIDLEQEVMDSIQGGRVKLDPDAEEKRQPSEPGGQAEGLHNHNWFWGMWPVTH